MLRVVFVALLLCCAAMADPAAGAEQDDKPALPEHVQKTVNMAKNVKDAQPELEAQIKSTKQKVAADVMREQAAEAEAKRTGKTVMKEAVDGLKKGVEGIKEQTKQRIMGGSGGKKNKQPAKPAAKGGDLFAAEHVQHLTDANFEHLTQASTGATTGDWLVKFYAPWCGHCKRLAPTWAALGDELAGEANVAHVDCTQDRATCQRFGVRSFPTLRFLHEGTMYAPPSRGKDELLAFVRGGFREAEGEPVPEPMSGLGAFVESVVGAIKGAMGLFRTNTGPAVALAATFFFMGVSVAGIMALILFTCCTGSYSDSDEQGAGEQGEGESKKND